MKKLNIILASEGESNDVPMEVPAVPVVELESQISALETELMLNPSLANDPEFKAFLEESKKINAQSQTQAQSQSQAQAQQPENIEEIEQNPTGANPSSKKSVDKSKNNELGSLAFFGDSTEEQVNFDEVTVDKLPEVAKSIGVDTTKKGWIKDFASKVIPQEGLQFKDKYEGLVESINALPKELAVAVGAAIEGKDWKSLVNSSQAVNYEKSFSDMSADEKIKVHNYYFPDDALQPGADITDKVTSKMMKAAEVKFSAEKSLAEQQAALRTQQASEKETKFKSSIDSSIAALKQEFPSFRKKDLDAAEEIAKTTGIHSLFFNKDGTMKPDGMKRLVFALNGQDILRVAMSLAESKGASKGKAEVLQSVPATEIPPAGANPLTDIEAELKKFNQSADVYGNLTY